MYRRRTALFPHQLQRRLRAVRVHPYATHNINECTLEEAPAARSSVNTRKASRSSDNLLRPCPLLDNLDGLRKAVNELRRTSDAQDLDLRVRRAYGEDG